MLIAIVLTLILVIACVFIHYEALRGVSVAMQRMTEPPRSRLLAVIAVAFVAHVVEIGLFAAAFWFMQWHWEMGALTGSVEGGLADFAYFSIATYTTLGLGDVFPSGPMRVTAAVESLVGLVLIGWSTSFTYLAMREFWDLHPGRGRRGK